MLPKIDFLSIVLRGGTEIYQKHDNPHIAESGETPYLSYDAINSYNNVENSPAPMTVDVTVMVSVPTGISSLQNETSTQVNYDLFSNIAASKYSKIRVVQSTRSGISEEIMLNSTAWLRPGGFIEKDSSTVFFAKQFSEFDGKTLQSTQDYASSVEIKSDKNGNETYCFPYKFTFTVPENEGGINTSHLSYFAYAYYDLESAALEGDLTLDSIKNSPLFKMMSIGKVQNQTVIQNGATKSSNQMFYSDTDNSVWTGPVHYHGPQNPGPNGYVGYMAGEGGNDMGPTLTVKSVSNNIIQDFRKYKDLQKLSFDYSLLSNSWSNLNTAQGLQNNIKGIMDSYVDNPYTAQDIEKYVIKSFSNASSQAIFGEMYTGMDGSGNTRFAFSLNAMEAIKQNTPFPALAMHLFENGTQDDLNQILNTKLIKDFKIYRHRVYEESPAHPTIDMCEDVKNEDIKLVVNTAEQSDGILLTKIEKSPQSQLNVGAIRQIDIDLPLVDTEGYSSSAIKFYTGTDLDTPVYGDYAFSIEVTMNDPIITWMESKIKSLEHLLYGEDSHSYNSYLILSKSSSSFYNLYTNRFTQEGIDALGIVFGTDFSYKTISQFISILDKFVFFENDQKRNELFSFLNTISSLEYGSPTGVDVAFKAMETIYQKIYNAYSSASKYKKPVDSQYAELQSAAGSSEPRAYTIVHKFKTEIKGQLNHLTGYDYLSIQNTSQEDAQIFDGLKNISADEYEQRASLEVSKLFSQPPPSVQNSQDNEINMAIHIGQSLLNPADSVEFTKYGYLSPSLINFAGASTHNLLVDGEINTNVAANKNALLNIIRQNFNNVQDVDFPTGIVGTSVGKNRGDSIAKPNSKSEMKYDISSLAALNQISIKTKDGKDIINSNTDPTDVFLAMFEQKYFNYLKDNSWKWEYYSKPQAMHEEYVRWNKYNNANNNALADSYTYSNSPLKRAPNHIKSLILQLSQNKKLKNFAFDSLKDYLESTKPEAYEYNVSQEKTSPKDPMDYFIADNKIISKKKVIYQTPEFLAFFILNYKKIVKIECLLGYNNGDINNPVWQEMTYQTWQTMNSRSGNVICRMMPYKKDLYGVKKYDFLDLPIYNKHFIVNFAIKGEYVSEPLQTEESQTTPLEVVVGSTKRFISPVQPTREDQVAQARAEITLPAYNPLRAGETTVQSLETAVRMPSVTQADTLQQQSGMLTGTGTTNTSVVTSPVTTSY